VSSTARESSGPAIGAPLTVELVWKSPILTTAKRSPGDRRRRVAGYLRRDGASMHRAPIVLANEHRIRDQERGMCFAHSGTTSEALHVTRATVRRRPSPSSSSHSRNIGGRRNAGTANPNRPSTPHTRSSTIPNQANASEVVRRLRRNVADTLPTGISRCNGSLAVGICG
jgi:hypothetical protein